MKPKRKLNKLKIAIMVIPILLILSISVFGRYIYNSVREAYLTARKFYFSSDILTVNGAEYQYDNWGGLDVYPIKFDLYSYNNQISKLDYDLEYTVNCTTSNPDKIKCTINSYDENATDTEKGIIYATTNASQVVVFVKPLVKLNEKEEVKIQVRAWTDEPYQKELSCEFTLQIMNQSGINYEIEDEQNREYALLKLENIDDVATEITLEFDPNELRLDMNNDIYFNNVSVGQTTISGNQYVNKVVFELSATSAKNVKFYKVDKTQNYEYPGVDDASAITVTT